MILEKVIIKKERERSNPVILNNEIITGYSVEKGARVWANICVLSTNDTPAFTLTDSQGVPFQLNLDLAPNALCPISMRNTAVLKDASIMFELGEPAQDDIIFNIYLARF